MRILLWFCLAAICTVRAHIPLPASLPPSFNLPPKEPKEAAFETSSETADECVERLILELEQKIVREFAQLAEDTFVDRAVLASDSTSEPEKQRAAERSVARELMAHIQKKNHRNMVDAQKEACRRREREIDNPCITTMFVAATRKCVVRKLSSELCEQWREQFATNSSSFSVSQFFRDMLNTFVPESLFDSSETE